MSQSLMNELSEAAQYSGLPDSVRYTNLASDKDDGKVKPNGPEIRRLRKHRGLSRERMADKTGIALKTLRNLESHPTYRCNPITLNTVAAYFHVEPQTLIEPENKPGIRILTSGQEIIEANIQIVASARKVLACIGSRSRDENYLRLIETTLEKHPKLIHFRTMALPPFKQQFQDHLLKLLKIRNPFCRAHGHKTIHVGIYDSILKQSESSICANETTALVVLPSLSGVGEYNTALLIQDPSMAEKYAGLAKSLYQMGRPIETEQEIRQLGLVKDGEKYV